MAKRPKSPVTWPFVGAMIIKLIDQPDVPERRMLVAALAQAIADARILRDGCERRAARRYFEEKGHYPLCDLIGIEPERVSGWVRRITT